MKLFRPINLLKDEYVIAVNPLPATQVSDCWNRLNFYTGRTLTHTALNTEQEHRSGHLWMYGRTLSPGIVWGLGLRAGQKVDADNTTSPEFIVEPGLGIACQGETVCLSVPMHVLVDKLPAPPGEVGIIVLKPVVADDAGPVDSTDQCQIDPADDAFADWRLIDGCRLAWVPWPWPDKPINCQQSDIKFRNCAAYTIFDHEAQLQAGEFLPWEKEGVPLGLVYINGSGGIEFIDRYAVVRQGGAPVARRSLVSISGNPFLWQAKVQVFISHIQDLLGRGESLATLKNFIRFLPPVGMLPADVIDFNHRQTDFFPTYYTIEAVPIPLEQFEVALDACASMASFDFYIADRVKILVPVPQEIYEPQLLQRAQIDPFFQQTIATLLSNLNIELDKRLVLRDMGRKVEGAIDTELIPKYDDPDPDAIEGEECDSSTRPYSYNHEVNTMEVLQLLYSWLGTYSPLSEAERSLIDPDRLVQDIQDTHDTQGTEDTFIGIKQFIDKLDEKINITNDNIDFGFLRLQTDIYRVRQVMLDASQATRLATSPILASIAKGVSSYATQQDLKNYFTWAKQTKPSVPKTTGNTDTFSGPTSPVANTSLAGGVIGSAGITPTAFQPQSVAYKVALQQPLTFQGISASTKAVTAAATAADTIIQQSPLIGESREFRTTTIASRIEESSGVEAKSYAVATKAAIISSLAALPINVADLPVTIGPRDVAILKQNVYQELLHNLRKDFGSEVLMVVEGRVRSSNNTTVVLYLGDFTNGERELLGNYVQNLRQVLDGLKGKQSLTDPDSLAGMIAAGMFDPDPDDGDEAAFLSVSVTAMENAVASLRKVEGRINGYRQARIKCEDTLTVLNGISSKWRKSLSEVDGNIAELRHDITVACTLKLEEDARIKAINDRRTEVLTNHVPFIGFARLRTASSQIDVPAVQLRGIYKDPVLACLNLQAPEELRNMLVLLQDVPLRWLLKIRQMVLHMDNLSIIKNAFQQARQRAQLQISQPAVLDLPQPSMTPALSTYGQTVNKVVTVHRQTAYALQQQRAALNLRTLETMTWKETINRAQDDLSLADLIEAGKGQATLAQRATQEMKNIENAATCFFTLCGSVLPVVRLGWAEKISEFDQPVSLRHLDALPSWSDVGFDLRRDLQRLVDWLFLCIDPDIPDAVSFMNDLVRVCILLACHAPVSLIINGHVSRATTGKIGDIIDLVLDKGKVTIGMQVAVLSGTTVAVQGIVEDLSKEAARVKVTRSSSGPAFTIAEGAKARFFMPGSVAPRLGR